MSRPDYCMFTPCDESKCGCKAWHARTAAQALEEPPGAHHLTPEDIEATIADLEQVASGSGEFPELHDRDWRTRCAVLSLQMRHLLAEVDRAYGEGRSDEREVWEPIARKAYEALETCDGDEDGYKGPVQWYRDDLVEAAYSSLAVALGEKPC